LHGVVIHLEFHFFQ